MVDHSHIHEFLSLELIEGILIAELKSEIVDLKIAKASVTHRLQQYNDKDYPLFINIKAVKHITKDARDYLASKEGCHKVASCAIIINSNVTRVLANYFIMINKPLVPTKVFTNEEGAKQWLSDYIN
jgi:hypothetical protein